MRSLVRFGLLAMAAGVSVAAPTEGIEQWRATRLERLKSETGWLTLVGLHWLKPGENRFGTDPSGAIVLPQGTAPPLAGSFYLDTGKVRVSATAGSGLTLRGSPVSEREVSSDESGEPDELRLGRLRLYVIKRGDRYAIRVKDPLAKTRTEFRELDYFPARADYRFEADFVAYATPKEVMIPTVLDATERYHAPGYVKFTFRGRELRLEPVVESPSDDKLFFIFRDLTSGKETYPAGRFLYTDRPKDGRVTLDFNRAYNPPCAFTPYATCPLPPKQNWLPIRIEAGEKKYSQEGDR